MDIPIDDAAFLGRGLAVRPGGWLHGPRVIIDGAPVKGRWRWGAWRPFVVRNNSGSDVEIELKSNHVDPIPKVRIGRREIELARPLVWYEYVWSGLPILMAYHGGAIGAVCGFAALRQSAAIFRSEDGMGKKFLFSGLVSIAAVVAYVILGSLFLALVGRWKP
jgi:hypothetical protein